MINGFDDFRNILNVDVVHDWHAWMVIEHTFVKLDFIGVAFVVICCLFKVELFAASNRMSKTVVVIVSTFGKFVVVRN